MKQSSITVARSLELEEIRSTGGFDHVNIIDTRREQDGATRPIEEGVLKRLKNHFIDYEQFTIENLEVDGSELVGRAAARQGDTLILSDDISAIANFCRCQEIPFKSKAFYVVETGTGDVVRTVPEAHGVRARFGTFGG